MKLEESGNTWAIFAQPGAPDAVPFDKLENI
jgi:hypothetical protein